MKIYSTHQNHVMRVTVKRAAAPRSDKVVQRVRASAEPFYSDMPVRVSLRRIQTKDISVMKVPIFQKMFVTRGASDGFIHDA